MRDDVVIFIITHMRAKKQLTLKTLKKGNCEFRIFLVVDDGDKELDAYKKMYGDSVLVFSKEEYWEKTDTITNKKIFSASVYARNACIDFAKSLGCKYYFVCDDDITRLNCRVPVDGKLKTRQVKNIGVILDAVVRWMEKSEQIKAVGLSGDGGYYGGVNQDVRRGIKYSMEKFVVYRVSNPLHYKGTIFEDKITVLEGYRRGELCFSFMGVSQVTPPNDTSEGGCSELYRTSSSYMECVSVILCRPDAVQLVQRNGDFGVRKTLDILVPKIVSDKWRKTDVR